MVDWVTLLFFNLTTWVFAFVLKGIDILILRLRVLRGNIRELSTFMGGLKRIRN